MLPTLSRTVFQTEEYLIDGARMEGPIKLVRLGIGFGERFGVTRIRDEPCLEFLTFRRSQSRSAPLDPSDRLCLKSGCCDGRSA